MRPWVRVPHDLFGELGLTPNTFPCRFPAHDLGGGLNLYFPGLSPGLMAEEAALDAHEVSQVTEGSLFNATASPCAPATGPTPSRGATPGSIAGKLKSFVPQDLSQLEVSAATATAVSPPRPLSRTKPHSPREGLGSVSTKVKRTERAISRVQERLQAAERLAMEVPALEDRIRALTEELDEHRRWKDEAVIYKRMATVLQEKVKETEAEALHSHSVVLENMARAFESQQNQQALLESFPVKSQLLSQLQSPASRMNDAEAASKFSPRRHRNNEFLDEVRLARPARANTKTRRLTLSSPFHATVPKRRRAGGRLGHYPAGDLRQGGQENQGLRPQAQLGRAVRGGGHYRGPVLVGVGRTGRPRPPREVGPPPARVGSFSFWVRGVLQLWKLK